MRKLLHSLMLMFVAFAASAQQVSVTWNVDAEGNMSSVKAGDDAYTSIISDSYLKGSNIANVQVINAADASSPLFASFYGATRQTGKASGYNVAYSVTPSAGHKFKPTKISFDACKVGTDGGNFDVYVKESGGSEIAVATNQSPLRNKVVEGSNPNGYSHHEYVLNNYLVDGKGFIVMIYFYNLNGMDSYNADNVFTGKAIALRNVQLSGAVDEEIYDVSHFVSSFTFKNAQGETIDLTSATKSLREGALYRHTTKLYGNPTDFNVVTKDGYTSEVSYTGTTATVRIYKNGVQVFYFEAMFTVTNRPAKPAAKPLSRGLMAINLVASKSTGNLISWRVRENDAEGTSFKLYRGTTASSQTTALNGGKVITGKSNFRDASGAANSYYRLEVLDAEGNVIEQTAAIKPWANQTLNVPVEAPIDLDHGATYNPNDASFCDMDGDGEYEIILKWSPSNEKDAASSGTTSSPYFDCLKLDGTRLWRIRLGDNFFTSAHTIQFIAWDFDGDGYGEFMCKTGPGTIDGEGNYVIMGNDDPTKNWLGSSGKQVEGPEYITVFDGMTGGELATIPYHTNYAAGANYWGDSNQNRSERYLAALAYLDGYDKNPSPIFARGYYSGAFVAAYDWDGETLKERWVSRNTQSGKGLWGEGAHWISVGDCDGDGKQEIVYGSAALDHDGSLLYRTGLGHGDALHLGDFLTERPGLELFMAHEEKPGYGVDLRDAKTGEIILRQTETGDTGRGLAAHFDSTQKSAQFLSSARAEMFNCEDGSVNGAKWAIGSSGAGINCRIYWDGDLFDEFFDKSIIAHWNPTNKSFDRYQVNGGNYTWGTLNNSSKNNPCVLGDLLGDWREEIVTHDGNATTTAKNLIINATSFESAYPVPHLMDDPQYRVQVVNQNCAYNQPPHLSYDPAVRFGAINVDPTPDPTPEPEPEKKGDLAEGTYYIQNVATGLYISAGASWGTRAILSESGLDFEAKLTGTDTYSIDSKVQNSATNHYLSTDEEPYVDAAIASITIKKQSNGTYTISNGTALLAADADNLTKYSASSSSSTSAQWRFITPQNMVSNLNTAQASTPVDATFLIQDANFGRNNSRFNTAWGEIDLPTKGGDNTNMNAEKWGGNTKTFTTQQTITLPNGWYTLSCDGFYRYNNTDENTNDVAIAAHAAGTEKIHSYLFANDEMVPLKSIADDEAAAALTALPFSQTEASAAFNQGLYSNSLLVEVTDGKMKLGVKKIEHEGTDWTVFDNFQLLYYGKTKPIDQPDEPDAIQTIESVDGASSIVTVQGIRIQKITTPGFYIVNGKKVLVK